MWASQIPNEIFQNETNRKEKVLTNKRRRRWLAVEKTPGSASVLSGFFAFVIGRMGEVTWFVWTAKSLYFFLFFSFSTVLLQINHISVFMMLGYPENLNVYVPAEKIAIPQCYFFKAELPILSFFGRSMNIIRFTGHICMLVANADSYRCSFIRWKHDHHGTTAPTNPLSRRWCLCVAFSSAPLNPATPTTKPQLDALTSRFPAFFFFCTDLYGVVTLRTSKHASRSRLISRWKNGTDGS